MSEPVPTQIQTLSAYIFFAAALFSGVLAFVFFSGAVNGFIVNPIAELMVVILSVALIMAGVTDLAVNHQGIQVANVFAAILVIIAVAEVVFNIYAFYLTNFGITHELSPTDLPLGIILATALIVFAAIDFFISHSPVRGVPVSG